ncbi:hypothetical protein Gotri_022537, partial [Gossypium trilobum]|nr:hypothetical protein [Gossypium trilobum]
PTTVLSTSHRCGYLIYPFSPFVVKICTAPVGNSIHLPLLRAVPKMKPFGKLALLIFCEDPAWIPKASNNVIIGKVMAFSTKSLIRLLQKIDMRKSSTTNVGIVSLVPPLKLEAPRGKAPLHEIEEIINSRTSNTLQCKALDHAD